MLRKADARSDSAVLTLPMLKNKLCRSSSWSSVILSRPVFASSTAPVAFLYLWYASVASRRSVLPVSVMPAVCASICVLPSPYVIDWSMPTYSEAGETPVIGLYSTELCEREGGTAYSDGGVRTRS